MINGWLPALAHRRSAGKIVVQAGKQALKGVGGWPGRGVIIRPPFFPAPRDDDHSWSFGLPRKTPLIDQFARGATAVIDLLIPIFVGCVARAARPPALFSCRHWSEVKNAPSYRPRTGCTGPQPVPVETERKRHSWASATCLLSVSASRKRRREEKKEG